MPSASHPHIALIPLPDLCPASEACCGACPGEVIHVAGWGRDESGGLPENLLMVHKPIHNHEQCHAEWNAAFPAMTITSRMFCTTVEDGIDSCNGDSGMKILLIDILLLTGFQLIFRKRNRSWWHPSWSRQFRISSLR